MKKVILLLVLAGLGVWGALLWAKHRGGAAPAYRTAKVRRGDLKATVSATGTIEPQEVIDVGAQVAGKIVRFGEDRHRRQAAGYATIDYGSQVEAGTVLAQIDDALYVPEVQIAEADLQVCEADVKRVEADLVQLKAKRDQAVKDFERGQQARMRGSTAISQSELDQLRYTYLAAQAAIPSGEATILKAKATVAKARGTLEKARQNLAYCTIKSPVSGVIVDRRVNVGQTVVASLNAPSLFLIAKDLNRMVIWASVNEADVGTIHPGQPVRFTVPAFPAETFFGHVANIRLNATMTSNVVTYTVVVAIDSDGGTLMPALQEALIDRGRVAGDDAKRGKLLPYLTANLQFEVNEHKGVLLVPNPALRWRPQPEQVAEEYRKDWAALLSSNKAGPGEKDAQAPDRLQGRTALWVKDGNYVRPVLVRVGLTDGKDTEVVGELKEGDEVVQGAEGEGRGGSGPFSSPFKR